MMLRRLAVVLGVMLVAGLAQSADLVKIEICASAPEFTNLEGADGKKHSLADYKNDVLVVAVTCNHCPVAVAYEDRLIDFVKQHGAKADLVAINVNNMEADKLDKMVERAKEKGFNFSYLYDPTQKVGKALGARVTPEFFVFDKNRKLVYKGAFDDNMEADSVTKSYVVEAVKATLGGSEAPKSTKPRGCGIKYDN